MDVTDLVESVRKNGYAYASDLLPVEWVDEVVAVLESSARARFNTNVPLGVFHNQQYFDTFAMAKSQRVFELITSPLVERVCELYLRDYILKCHRYYETYGDYVMGWHTDSKNQTSGILENHPGIVFIVYLTDTDHGEFQLVKGSHLKESDIPFHEYYTADFIANNYQDRVVSLKGKRGSLVIQETRAIHRARPMIDDNLPRDRVRKSLFFQIDTYPNNTEPMYLNPKWVNTNSIHQHKLFRIGRSDISVEPAHPRSNLGTWDSERFSPLLAS